MATSPIYSWPEPDNTDLVKNGALAIRTLGNAIDTTMGTMVAKTIIDAKGDLIAGTAADTAARLAVGNNGETLVADSAATTGLRYQSNFAAGKNAIINGAFNVWQRGTSFSTAGAWLFNADRFQGYMSSGTATLTQQTFTPGTAPVAGYEGTYYLRATAPASGGTFHFRQSIEDVRTFAGQTVTLSFWAKASATTSLNTYFNQQFGVGGSTSVNTATQTNTITTSWARYTYTVAMPSISGKTVGTGSYVEPYFVTVNNFTSSATLEYWGIQVEASNTATAFQTATGTLQGETSACQRYYETGLSAIWSGNTTSGSNYYLNIPFAVVKRTSTPTITLVTTGINGFPSISTASINAASFRITGTANVTGSGCYLAADSWVGSAEL